MSGVKEKKSTKVMKWVLTGVFSIVIILSLLNGFAGGSSGGNTSHQQSSRSADPFQ